MLQNGQLPMVFDTEDIYLCARTFAIDNGIPFDQLDLAVFENLVDLDNVADVFGSSLFCESAKTALRHSYHKAVETNIVRTFITQGIVQGIVRHLVVPTKQELEHPLSQCSLDGADTDPQWKTMGDHPFASRCVSCKFLQFWVAPSGQLSFLCDLYDLPSEDKLDMSKTWRLIEWANDVKSRLPAIVSCVGVPPPPEDISREQVALMSKLLVVSMQPYHARSMRVSRRHQKGHGSASCVPRN
jgi:hypothetical protein